jgi:lactate dehydrogenase-like 2-hydroxyacid dehydrogenase
MRPDVLQPKPLPEGAQRVLEQHFTVHKLWTAPDAEAVVAALAPHCRYAVCTGHYPFDAAFLARFPALEIVSNYGVGYDTVDTAAAAARGVVVTNTPGVLDDEVADTTIALILSTIRRIPQADAYVRAGRWLEKPFPLTASLVGRSVGLVGMGRIGQAIAKRISAFAVKEIAYHARAPRPDLPYRYAPSLVDMARDVDVLVVIVPGGAGTKHLVDRAVMEALGPGGCLVNVARGSVVDEAALVDCLTTGKLGMAGLDVFEDEPRVPEALFALENVVLTPHVGSASTQTRNAMGLLVVENLVAWKEGRVPPTPVPETPVPARG